MRQRDTYEVTCESAVAMADYILSQTHSESTLQKYRQAQRQLARLGLNPQQFRDNCAFVDKKPITESRYRTLKAGFQLGCADQIMNHKLSAEQMRAQGDHDSAAAYEAEILTVGRVLAAQEPDYERKRYKLGRGSAAHPMPKTEQKITKCGLRKHLGMLNRKEPDWRLLIFNDIPKQHVMAMALLNLTGCRPCELCGPVKLEVRNGLLVVTINGAKVTKYSGQEERKLVFDPEQDPWAQWVIGTARVSSRNGKSFTWKGIETTLRALQRVHERTVKRVLGPKWVGKVAPYSYRHAFSADLKAGGHTRKEIALAMGHRTDKSQAFYGMASQATDSGGRGLVEATATHEVKTRESVAERILRRESAPEI